MQVRFLPPALNTGATMTAKKRPLSGGKKKAKELAPPTTEMVFVGPPITIAPLRTVARTGAALTEAVAYLSDMFEQAGLPNEFAQVYDAITDTTSALEKLKEMTKDRLLAAVIAQGAQVTEKGTRRLVVGGWQTEARPHRTGLDDKKVEALLRAKGYTDLSRGMEQVITYKASSDKLATLVSAGILTQDELDTCNVDFTWALQKPKRVSADNTDENTDNGEYT